MPSYREFTLARKDYSDTLKLRVYKTAKGMNAGLIAINKNAEGCKFGAVFTATYDLDKGEDGNFTSSMYGVILLNEQNMDMTNISHECVHAALSHDRQVNRFTGSYEGEDDEERLAYYYDWLLVEVLSTLKKNGYKVKCLKEER